MGNSTSSTNTSPTEATSSSQSSCPVAPVYNVYNERINDSNSIPVGLHNTPRSDQTKPLSLDRAHSTIPKGGIEETWTYPSPQMFFNALKRKGKGDDIVEDDMESVVHAHNTLNDTTWLHVLRWEHLHQDECCEPKLQRFCGRPHKLTPKAVFWTMLGYRPFDRHDWYVDRCGKEMRYVIDFYFDEEKAGEAKAFQIDARPALDSFTALHDRIKMSVYILCQHFGLPCPITGHSIQRDAKKDEERVETKSTYS